VILAFGLDQLRAELDGAARAAGYSDSTIAPWALFGSTVLALWGLRNDVGDIDVFVDGSIWRHLDDTGRWTFRCPNPSDPGYLERELKGRPVHAFYAWTSRQPEVDAVQCRRTAQVVNGIPCTPLAIVRMHKAMAIEKWPRDPRVRKDRADVAAIDELTLGKAA
jgi:hypothetical protein